MKREQYLLRNVTKYDINLGDLRYKIPAGQTRDLFGPKAHLTPELIQKSRESGSIKARLGKSLIEVQADVRPRRPLKKLSSVAVVPFPQRQKSYITLEVSDIIDEYENAQLVAEDEDSFLKELEENDFMGREGSAPIVHKDAKTKD